MGVCSLKDAGARSAGAPVTHAASSVGGALPPPPRRAQEKRTPLHLAAQNGHVEVVKVLLEQGVNIEAEDEVRLVDVRSVWAHARLCTPVQVALVIPPCKLRARLAARSHSRLAAHRASARRCTSRRAKATRSW